MKYRVFSKNAKGDDVIETTRTDRSAAEKDVRLLKDICRKRGLTIQEVK